jgi:hypothetical protein
MSCGGFDGGWDVVLRLRCAARYARLVRTSAAACAVLEGFSVDGLDDVRLLVDEVFMTMHNVGVEWLEVRLMPHGGRLDIEMVAERPVPRLDASPDAGLVQRVIDAIAERATLDLTADRPAFAATLPMA